MKAANDAATGYISAIASVLMVSFSQISLRFGMMQVPGEPSIENYLIQVFDRGGWLVPTALGAGVLAYGVSFLLWLITLRSLPLSLAYPLLSLSYPIVYITALLLPGFGGQFDIFQACGIGLIVIGVSVLTWQS